MFTPKNLRSALAGGIATARRMRLSELERVSIDPDEPVVALWIDESGAVSVITREQFEHDCSRAIVVRPWRSSETALRQAIEDALEIVEPVRRAAA